MYIETYIESVTLHNTLLQEITILDVNVLPTRWRPNLSCGDYDIKEKLKQNFLEGGREGVREGGRRGGREGGVKRGRRGGREGRRKGGKRKERREKNKNEREHKK